MSNRNRIERLREEAVLTERTKADARAKACRPTRLMAVWVVKSGAGEIVATYPYGRKDAAETEAKRRTKAERRTFIVCPHKVPFE